LPDKAAFDRVFGGCRRSRDPCFTVLFRQNGERRARLGLAIAKKHCRLATDRNRLKRIVRESFRLRQRELAGLDIVVLNRPDAANAGNKQLFDSLAAHWQRCRRREQG
jgi:ribonuclease P protein component